ncbi:YbfB/YjiJ family MFS transporter [Escherichia coli]
MPGLTLGMGLGRFLIYAYVAVMMAEGAFSLASSGGLPAANYAGSGWQFL